MTIYLDTNVLVYLVETIPKWVRITEARLRALGRSDETQLLAISDLSRLECRVGPLRSQDVALLQAYGDFFKRTDVRVVPIVDTVFDLAAEIRAAYRFKTIDALHLAAAVEARCDAFLTNDLKLGTFPGLPVEVLS